MGPRAACLPPGRAVFQTAAVPRTHHCENKNLQDKTWVSAPRVPRTAWFCCGLWGGLGLDDPMCCLPAPCQLLRCSRSSSSHPCSAQCSYEVFFPKMLFCFWDAPAGSGGLWLSLESAESARQFPVPRGRRCAGGSCLALWGQHGPKGRDKCGEVIRGCPRGAGSGGGGDALGGRLRGRVCNTVPLWHRSSRAPHLLPPPAPVILSTLLRPSQPPEDRLQLRRVPPYPGTVTQAGRAPSVFSTTVY